MLKRLQNWWKKRTHEAEAFTVDEQGVRRFPSSDEAISWADLAGVHILTTDQGPFCEDAWWVLLKQDGSPVCWVPNGSPCIKPLMARVMELPNVDEMAVVVSMGHTDKARFVIWRREDFDGPSNI